MERRLFVKKTGLLTTGILVLSTDSILATTTQKDVTNLDLTPVLTTGKNIIIKGLVLDARTNLPINTDINISTKRNRFYSKNHLLTALNGIYSIHTGFSNSEKVSEKMNFKINVDGYKPYNGNLYITKSGCNIHSDQWQYNPDFKSENRPINNEQTNTFVSTFNFYLVKAS
ncbi:hypothetical protein LNQ49_07625 [Flavobacterium sp. F-65]|jgi:hypothetical protein|uniref:CarboxypepD_reg-like domain-containing protein n=1 Tax=Flavobacterium pisciphilum TaxID=2893755 RepID=A0ABS8MTF7_9FLAO|nr:hypothetical protein [Flavobacterium sp. F-65]MCC9071456.1 hypothetical protein [Flavobacterium sp. F-65]